MMHGYNGPHGKSRGVALPRFRPHERYQNASPDVTLAGISASNTGQVGKMVKRLELNMFGTPLLAAAAAIVGGGDQLGGFSGSGA